MHTQAHGGTHIHTGTCTETPTRACALCARTHAVHVFVARGHACVQADMHVHIRTNTYTHSHTSCRLPATPCRRAQGAGCQPHARTPSGLPTPGPAHPVTLGDVQPTKSPDFPNLRHLAAPAPLEEAGDGAGNTPDGTTVFIKQVTELHRTIFPSPVQFPPGPTSHGCPCWPQALQRGLGSLGEPQGLGRTQRGGCWNRDGSHTHFLGHWAEMQTRGHTHLPSPRVGQWARLRPRARSRGASLPFPAPRRTEDTPSGGLLISICSVRDRRILGPPALT